MEIPLVHSNLSMLAVTQITKCHRVHWVRWLNMNKNWLISKIIRMVVTKRRASATLLFMIAELAWWDLKTKAWRLMSCSSIRIWTSKRWRNNVKPSKISLYSDAMSACWDTLSMEKHFINLYIILHCCTLQIQPSVSMIRRKQRKTGGRVI